MVTGPKNAKRYDNLHNEKVVFAHCILINHYCLVPKHITYDLKPTSRILHPYVEVSGSNPFTNYWRSDFDIHAATYHVLIQSVF